MHSEPESAGQGLPGGDGSREGAFLWAALTNSVLWLRRHSGGEGREPAGFPIYQPQPPPPSLLSDKKGFAGRCCGLGRKGISSLSPHTTAHVDGFPGSGLQLCVFLQCSPAADQTWGQNQKPPNPEPHSSLALLPSKRLKPLAIHFPEIGSGPKSSH